MVTTTTSQDNKKSSKKIIRVEIIDSKPNNFYIMDLDKIDPKKVTLKDLDFRLNVIISTNIKGKRIKIEIELDAFLKKKDDLEGQNIFGIKSITIFGTPDFNKIVDKNGEITAPKEFVKKLLNICIGGVRGMLSANLINTGLSHITLPLLDLSMVVEKNN